MGAPVSGLDSQGYWWPCCSRGSGCERGRAPPAPPYRTPLRRRGTRPIIWVPLVARRTLRLFRFNYLLPRPLLARFVLPLEFPLCIRGAGPPCRMTSCMNCVNGGGSAVRFPMPSCGRGRPRRVIRMRVARKTQRKIRMPRPPGPGNGIARQRTRWDICKVRRLFRISAASRMLFGLPLSWARMR